MSMYLQRLVSMAQRAGGDVHPVLRPYFAHAPADSADISTDSADISTDSADISTDSADRPADPADLPADSAENLAEESAAGAPVARPSVTRAPRPGGADDPRMHPERELPARSLVEGSARRESSAARDADVGEIRAENTGVSDVAAEAPRFAPRPALRNGIRHEVPAPAEDRYEPLLPERPAMPLPVTQPPPPASHAMALRLEPPHRSTASRGNSPTTRDSDDVHIHIGRIEVSALSTRSAAIAPAAPPRKSPNLDEYLRRRKGDGR